MGLRLGALRGEAAATRQRGCERALNSLSNSISEYLGMKAAKLARSAAPRTHARLTDRSCSGSFSWT